MSHQPTFTSSIPVNHVEPMDNCPFFHQIMIPVGLWIGFYAQFLRVSTKDPDRVVMDTLCAILGLSANAMASGPHAVKHFATEWVIPSSRNLPAFAVVSVVLHLALEGIITGWNQRYLAATFELRDCRCSPFANFCRCLCVTRDV